MVYIELDTLCWMEELGKGGNNAADVFSYAAGLSNNADIGMMVPSQAL